MIFFYFAVFKSQTIHTQLHQMDINMLKSLDFPAIISRTFLFVYSFALSFLLGQKSLGGPYSSTGSQSAACIYKLAQC